MSHQGESLFQKFEHFLKILQFGINKGLDNNFVTINIKKVVEVHPNVRDVKKEILITFEIKDKVKIVHIAFVVKEEVKESLKE
jgi:hypothetical protein